MTLADSLPPAGPDRAAPVVHSTDRPRPQLPLALHGRDGRPLTLDPDADVPPFAGGIVAHERAERPVTDRAQLSLFAMRRPR